MKTNRRIKGLYTIHFIILSLLMSVIIISCGGCKGSKVVTQASSNPQTENNSGNDEKKDLQNSQIIKQYPYTENNTTYINDTTMIIGGIKIVTTRNTSKLIFPNGKVITKNDYPITKDLPDKLKKDHEYKSDGYIDLTKLERSKKRSLLANMDGYKEKDIDNYVEADISFNTYGLHDTLEERVYLITDLQIWRKIIISEDDIRWEIVGQIGAMEIYDKIGNKLYDIKLDKFGCEQFCITPDKKHIIINTNGDNDSDKNMVNRGAITIWSYDNPKMIDYVYHYPDYIIYNGIGCANNVSLTALIPNTELALEMGVMLEKKLVFTLEYPSSKSYAVNFSATNDGSFQFRDGIIYKKGSLGFNQYSIEEWNGYVDSLWKKKLLVNEK
ncbi:MAG: hypothetical protein KA341_06075 [Saprospiraceae bacterium]|nr:hypothetical protein [Saprospiraceae bacterium]